MWSPGGDVGREPQPSQTLSPMGGVLLGVHACFSLVVSKGKARALLYLGHCKYVGITKLLCLTLLTEISAITVYL